MAKRNSNTLTAERARELLRYDPETGKLFWRVSRGRVCAGDEAVCVTSRGYLRVRIDGQLYLTHRIAWLITTGTWPTEQIDHIDGGRQNNRWYNLREVSNSDNHRNTKRRNDNTSGVTGVCWLETRRKWKAHIGVNGLSVHLGYFDSLPAAIAVRRAAERQHRFHKNHGRAT